MVTILWVCLFKWNVIFPLFSAKAISVKASLLLAIIIVATFSMYAFHDAPPEGGKHILNGEHYSKKRCIVALVNMSIYCNQSLTTLLEEPYLL